jgi:hypothetical protein
MTAFTSPVGPWRYCYHGPRHPFQVSANAVTEELKETDARYREEAKRVFLAGDGGGPQDLFRAEGKDRRAGHDRH